MQAQVHFIFIARAGKPRPSCHLEVLGMTEPDDKLVALLKGVGLSLDFAKMIASKKCRTVALLSEWRDEPKELKSLLAGTKYEQDDESFPLLKLAFKQAIEDTARDRKRKSLGIDEDAEHTLLSEEASTAMREKFRAYYRILVVDSRACASDSQISKFRKEFERNNPQFIALGPYKRKHRRRREKRLHQSASRGM